MYSCLCDANERYDIMKHKDIIMSKTDETPSKLDMLLAPDISFT